MNVRKDRENLDTVSSLVRPRIVEVVERLQVDKQFFLQKLRHILGHAHFQVRHVMLQTAFVMLDAEMALVKRHRVWIKVLIIFFEGFMMGLFFGFFGSSVMLSDVFFLFCFMSGSASVGINILGGVSLSF